MVGFHESDDKCAICPHEHENWGDNEHCRKCKKETLAMKEYKYAGFAEPVIVDNKGNASYRGREVEQYCHGYNAVGMASGFSVKQLAKAHYISEMKRIDAEIAAEDYRKEHPEEVNNLETADESLQYFLEMVNGERGDL